MWVVSRQLGLLNRLRVTVQVVSTLFDSLAVSIRRSFRILDLRFARSLDDVWKIFMEIHGVDGQQFIDCYAPEVVERFKNARGNFQRQELLNKLADDYGRVGGHFRRGASEAIRRIVQLPGQKEDMLTDFEILTRLMRNGVNIKEVLSEAQTGGG